MQNRWWTRRDDDGFTLVEVIVALALLGIVASAALIFFVRGTSGAAVMQRKQSAVALANQATDLARSLDPDDLVKGRLAATAKSYWDASSAPDKALSYLASSSTATTTSVPALPFAATQTVSNQKFVVNTLIGSCYRKRADVAASACTVLPSAATAPANAPSGYVRLYRVIVEVTWSSKGQASGCTAGACIYRVSTLIDPTADPLWNVKAKPIPNATPRVVYAQANETATAVDLKIASLASNSDANTEVRITDTTGLTAGQLLVDGKNYNKDTNYRGKVVSYVPLSGTVGAYSVKYYLINADGQSSSVVNLTIRVIPVAVADSSVTTTVGTTKTVNFGTNDKPNTFGSIVEYNPGSLKVNAASTGTCTVGTPDANGQVTFKGLTKGKCVYTYSIRGVGSNTALVSDDGLITVTVN